MLVMEEANEKGGPYVRIMTREDRVAPIPGISIEGEYEDYAKNPRAYFRQP
jgi:hypothetical protein